MLEKIKNFNISSFTLHIIAMFCMLLDHSWASAVSGNLWLTCVGRIAFPIFAFMIVEGFYHTHDVNKYLKRLLIFALISEIPFNLLASSSIIFPFHQNVMFTFLIGLLCIKQLDKIKNSDDSPSIKAIKLFGITLLGFLVGTVTMVDYFGPGVLTVIIFYIFHEKNLFNKVGQFLGLYYINFVLLAGQTIPLFGFDFNIQGFAIFALIPIWLYKGRQGPHSKAIQYSFYAFYPLHMLILYIISYIQYYL